MISHLPFNQYHGSFPSLVCSIIFDFALLPFAITSIMVHLSFVLLVSGESNTNPVTHGFFQPRPSCTRHILFR